MIKLLAHSLVTTNWHTDIWEVKIDKYRTNFGI